MTTSKKSNISISVELDDNRVPKKLSWSSDEGHTFNKDAKATFLSIWDEQAQETLKIDLWTKDMPVDSMKRFFHQTLLSMKDTFLKATQDEKMTETMQDFCDYFAEKLKLNENN